MSASVATARMTAPAADAAEKVPAAISAAVADAARPDADKQRDADRKPAESIAFAGIKKGDHVAELLPGGGYFTRIFSKVVGDKGVVYALAPPPRPDAPAGAPDPAAAVDGDRGGLQEREGRDAEPGRNSRRSRWTWCGPR